MVVQAIHVPVTLLADDAEVQGSVQVKHLQMSGTAMLGYRYLQQQHALSVMIFDY